EGREHVFADEERIAVADSFVRQDFQEVVVVDRAVRIEDVLAGHLAPLIEDVNLLELSPSDLLQRSRHEDSGDGGADPSEYESGKQTSDRPMHTLTAWVGRELPLASCTEKQSGPRLSYE